MKDVFIDNYNSLVFHQRYQVINPYRLCFIDDLLEQEYTADLADNIARQVRWPWPWPWHSRCILIFAFLDYLLVPEKMTALWGIRAAVCALFSTATIMTQALIFVLPGHCYCWLAVY